MNSDTSRNLSKESMIEQEWLGTWASSQQGLAPTREEYPPAPGLANNTFRQTIRISIGGAHIRLLFSNEYGKTPLEMNSVHIAKPDGIATSAILTNTDTTVTFHNGSKRVIIPAGESVLSDSICFDVAALERITVSIFFGAVPADVTSHTGARTTTYLVKENHVTDAILSDATTMEQWYYLTAIDVLADGNCRSVVCLGDSTTDGRGVRTNYYDRWTDIFAERLLHNQTTSHRSVLNQGIGGNALGGGLGPAANLRYERDTIMQTNPGFIIVLEGINDIGFVESLDSANQIIESYIQFSKIAHEHNIKIYGGTITPFGGFTEYYTKEHGEMREQVRQTVNAWIRNNDYYDGFIDFDAALLNPSNPLLLDSRYDSGDGLHPNPAGYLQMGNCIPLSFFE